MEKLKSCPCCGSKTVLTGKSRYMTGKHWIGCEDCPLCVYDDTLKQAIKAWNTRADVGVDEEKVFEIINQYSDKIEIYSSSTGKLYNMHKRNLAKALASVDILEDNE